MDTLISLKNEYDDFSVEFDVMPPVEIAKPVDERKNKILDGLNNVKERMEVNQKHIDDINAEIERLTNHADGIDYMVAVGSGILAGIIDSVWVGEFSFERGNKWGKDKVNNFVVKVAQSQGYPGDDLAGAVQFLEDMYAAPSDSVTSQFGGGKQHHLRDFAHHPTPVGLMFSLLTQFTGYAYGTDTSGLFKAEKITNTSYIGKDIPHKLLYGVVYWFFHMVSDMAGSNAFAGSGTGLPGPILSLIKELSVLPFFRNLKVSNIEFSQWISKLFNGTLLAKRDENGKIIEAVRFDLRAEIGVLHEIGRQAIPVIINECIVRGFYFIRRFAMELKDKKVKSLSDLKNIEWKNTLPAKNRTIIRMLTISTGTFTAIDLADAAIRSAVKSGGLTPAFLSNFILRVNFVGVGRFAIAVGTDIGMGVRRSKLRNERMYIYSEQINLYNVKVFYKQADMWIAAGNAGETIEKAFERIEKTNNYLMDSMQDMGENLKKISDCIPEIKQKNPGLIEDINDIITWG
jgi:archaellum component FlaC